MSSTSPDHLPRILLVDDEPNNIQLLADLLCDMYHLTIATNGPLALKIASRSEPPTVILLDISMPGMDGYEVCRVLKEDPRTAMIPVLFVTALSSEEQEQKGLALGAHDFISKPFKPGLLRQRIRNAVLFSQQRLELIGRISQLEELNRQLVQEKETVKILRGLLPICCVCKKIRNDTGYWEQLETHFSQHSGVTFSHGYCPECAAAAMAELDAHHKRRLDEKPD